MARKTKDYSTPLIMAALLVTVARYVGAFLASDLGSLEGQVSQGITILMGLTGIGMGVLDVLGGAYIFDGWRSGMPKAGHRWSFRFKVLTVFVFGLFGVGLVILVPFTISRVTHQGMSQVLGNGAALWVWSFAVNVAPYLLIGGVVAGQKGIVSVERSQAEERQTAKYPNGHQPGGERFRNFPEITGETYQDWRTVPDEDKVLIANMTSRKIAATYGLSPRTARNWRRQAIEFIEKDHKESA